MTKKSTGFYLEKLSYFDSVTHIFWKRSKNFFLENKFSTNIYSKKNFQMFCEALKTEFKSNKGPRVISYKFLQNMILKYWIDSVLAQPFNQSSTLEQIYPLPLLSSLQFTLHSKCFVVVGYSNNLLDAFFKTNIWKKSFVT